MNRIYSSNARKYIALLSGGFALAMLTLSALFAFEAAPARFATNEALAWHCESMTVEQEGSDPFEHRLQWQFSADEGITVTIDEIPGKSWQGVSGNALVQTQERMTYTARAHKEGSNNTQTCSVVVEPPVEEQGCGEVNMNVGGDGYSWQWQASHQLEGYRVDFCDGSHIEQNQTSWSKQEQFQYQNRTISRVQAYGGACSHQIEHDCDCDEPEEEQHQHGCGEGGVTIDHDGYGWQWQHQHKLEGYTVHFCDGTSEHVSGGHQWQNQEQFRYQHRHVVRVEAHGGGCEHEHHHEHECGECGHQHQHGHDCDHDCDGGCDNDCGGGHHGGCDDCPDCPECPKCPECPDCPPVYDPWCALGVDPNPIQEGESTTLWWDSNDVSSVDITHIGTGLEPESWRTVSPKVGETTYDGTFYALDGSTHYCSFTVTVIPHEEPVPSCDMWADPTVIASGEGSSIGWTSANVDSVVFDNGISSTELSGSETVYPTETTLYTGTFTYDCDKTIECSIEVTVEDEPPVHDPWCALGLNSDTIEEGESTILWWDSNDIESVDITNIGTGLEASSTRTVSPGVGTTVYDGTFYAVDDTVHYCSATLTVVPEQEEPLPTCDLSASPNKLGIGGGDVTLTWTSDNATSGSISPTIGDLDDLNDSEVVNVRSNTTFTGTFTDDLENTVTCSTYVKVETGGGGSCLNCDDDDDDDEEEEEERIDPTILLSRTITKAGGFITLDQVPYTGFEAGPVLTTFFWLAVLAISAGIAYVLTQVRPFERFQMAMARRYAEAENIYRHQEREQIAEQMRVSPSMVADAPVALGTDHDDHVSHIEEVAHRDSILLSPEAVRLIQSGIAQSGKDVELFLTSIIEAAKAQYPREDGWILLSKERALELLGGKDSPAKNTPVAAAAQVAEAPKETPIRVAPTKISAAAEAVPEATTNSVAPTENDDATNAVVPKFVELLANLEQKKAFDLLRKMTAQGISVNAFIGRVVRELDEVYKHRIEGNHKPDKQLAALTATWADADFEKVLGILVESVDYSYSSERVGAKVALAKVFEYFEAKK